ncbi:MAG: hypothetical protein WC564_04075 [Patescibacteria group bacterium]|jgi:hypothetical protein
MSFKIKSNFIYSFKIGDNICYNFEILNTLYKYFEEENDRNKLLLCKSITITVISIIEALLIDFYYRINSLVREGVPGFDPDMLKVVREDISKDKEFFKFEKIIKNIKEKNLFNKSESFYDALDKLRKLRNRIHIQNQKQFVEPDEALAFNHNRRELSEIICEIILKKLESEHGRGETFDYVNDFFAPWGPHY